MQRPSSWQHARTTGQPRSEKTPSIMNFFNISLTFAPVWSGVIGFPPPYSRKALAFFLSTVVGKELVKDEAKDVVLVFIGLYLGAHLVGCCPDLAGKLLFVHTAL